MLRIDGAVIDEVRAVTDPAGLHRHLQAAVELEHATIPAYLAALYSIKSGRNPAAAAILRSVVVEEMLHMTIAANVLNALGGAPRLDRPGFIPVFPGPLPMGVRGGLEVGLHRLTRGLVASTFMVIEEPEAPIEIPVDEPATRRFAALGGNGPPQGPATIGQFYAAIVEKIRQLGQGAFTGAPQRQVVDGTWFPADQLFAVTTVDDAVRALQVIVEQGEGTRTSPEDGAVPAHYYRFAEIVNGRSLVRDGSSPTRWSYSGAPVDVDPAGVWNVLEDPKTVDYPPGSRARMLAEQFNVGYTNLLRALEETFNGDPPHLEVALGLMYELRLTATAIVSTPLPGTGYQAGPTFEYTAR
jgi:hypothetical protein